MFFCRGQKLTLHDAMATSSGWPSFKAYFRQETALTLVQNDFVVNEMAFDEIFTVIFSFKPECLNRQNQAEQRLDLVSIIQHRVNKAISNKRHIEIVSVR